MSTTDSNDSNESDTHTSPSRLEKIRRKFVNAVKVSHFMTPNYKKPSIESLDDNDYGNDDSKIFGTKHVQYQYYNSCCRTDSSRKVGEEQRRSSSEVKHSGKVVRNLSYDRVYKNSSR
jgi:hypothetical protein